jgi:transcriptional regulator with XRE-family HTH domain
MRTMSPTEFDILTNTQIEAELGSRLKRRRVELGLNQTEAAERAGLARRTVSSVERGQGASLATLVAMLRALDAINELQRLLPDPGPSPIALTEGRSSRVKERKNPYKPRGKKTPPTPEGPWKWDDEK